jgi:hypothetical protein
MPVWLAKKMLSAAGCENEAPFYRNPTLGKTPFRLWALLIPLPAVAEA